MVSEQIKEILDKTELSDVEVLFLIEEFIYEVKGEKVNINRPTTGTRLQLMNIAFRTAYTYFKQKENGQN